MTSIRKDELIDSIPDYSDNTEYAAIPWDTRGNLIVGTPRAATVSGSLAAFSYAAALNAYSSALYTDFSDKELFSPDICDTISPDRSFASSVLIFSRRIRDRLISAYPDCQFCSFARILDHMLELQLEHDAGFKFSFERQTCIQGFQDILRKIRLLIERTLAGCFDERIPDVRLLYVLCYFCRITFETRDSAEAYLYSRLPEALAPESGSPDADLAVEFANAVDRIEGIAAVSDLVKAYFIVHCVWRFNAGCRCDEWIRCTCPDPAVCKDCECPEKGSLTDEEDIEEDIEEDDGESSFDGIDLPFDPELFASAEPENEDDNDSIFDEVFDFSDDEE